MRLLVMRKMGLQDLAMSRIPLILEVFNVPPFFQSQCIENEEMEISWTCSRVQQQTKQTNTKKSFCKKSSRLIAPKQSWLSGRQMRKVVLQLPALSKCASELQKFETFFSPRCQAAFNISASSAAAWQLLLTFLSANLCGDGLLLVFC